MQDGVKRQRLIRYRVGLGALISLLLIATVSTIGWITFLNTRAAIGGMVNQRIDDILRGLGERARQHMLSAVPAVELSKILVGESLVSKNQDALARQFSAVLRANPSFSWASYSDEAGNFTGAYRAVDGSLHVSETTTRAGGEVRDHAVDTGGNWSQPFYQKNYGYDPRADLFYREVSRTHSRSWIGPYVFFDEGVPGITCASPHFTPGGRLLGVFTIDFNLNFLSRFVSELQFGSNGRVFILTRDGKVIAHPTLRLVEVTGQGAAGKLVGVADVADQVLQAFYAALPAHVVRQGETRETSSGAQFAFSHAGQRYLAGYRVVEIDKGLTWIVGAATLESDFMAVLARNRMITFILSSAALCVGVISTILLARRISVPLSRLAAEMGEIGSFRLTKRPRMRTVFKEVALMDESLLNTKGSLRSFSYYVPTDLVRTMLASGREATLQGETRNLTVYFSDIAGFTTIAEGMTPDQLVRHLSRYLDEMTQMIAQQGGTVDKFIGDAIMAFWGAPVEVADHASRACVAAMQSQRKLAEIRAAAGTPWLAAIQARIGIATGEVLVGNIGSQERFNYTVMGDTVNLASRLESLNKIYGTNILISDATRQGVRGHVVTRPIDVVRVKGKYQCVRIHEPLCLAAESDQMARDLASCFEKGFEAYISGNFREAAAWYEHSLHIHPDDPPAAAMLERCRRFIEQPPSPDWDGVYIASAK